MRSTWTHQRVERLFAHYKKKYWRSRLLHFKIKIADLKGVLGQCWTKERRIVLNVEAHKSDREIRGTLLHEMCHAATRTREGEHGYGFWQQVERLLRQNAPIAVTGSEPPVHRTYANAIPRRFPLAREAMRKVKAQRARKVEAQFKQDNVKTITPEMIIGDFRDAALATTCKPAKYFIGIKHGLLDVGGKPGSRWAARILREGRKAFQRRRRELLADRKFQAEVFGALDATGRNASEQPYNGTEE